MKTLTLINISFYKDCARMFSKLLENFCSSVNMKQNSKSDPSQDLTKRDTLEVRPTPSSPSHVLPGGAASAVEGLEALRHRPRAVLRLPLHRDEVEACARRRQRNEAAATERQSGEARDGMVKSRAAGA